MFWSKNENWKEYICSLGESSLPIYFFQVPLYIIDVACSIHKRKKNRSSPTISKCLYIHWHLLSSIHIYTLTVLYMQIYFKRNKNWTDSFIKIYIYSTPIIYILFLWTSIFSWIHQFPLTIKRKFYLFSLFASAGAHFLRFVID